ncbi:MAG: hypothetical protein EKK64_02905 [Neisseriaceae bacterium]|nr:MAG: hypothetical protein EKK64_02905 [Neisseriaceae bacterium]
MKVYCCICGKEFIRNNSEVLRNKRLGRNVYCSRKCFSTVSIKNIPKENKKWHHLKKGSFVDNFSPFRWHYRNILKRSKEVSISLQDLKDQWELQKGLCPYTKWPLKNMSSYTNRLEKTPDRASLDRIDSSKGYIKGNIQFVSLISQYAKNNWNENVIFDFAKAVLKENDSFLH